MLVYHYPGLEFISERQKHWEINIPIHHFKKLYPNLKSIPKLLSVEDYVKNREKHATKIKAKGFLHLWYYDKKKPIWDETINYICNQKDKYTPASIVWSWKRPHLSPIENCLPHNVTMRCNERELIGDLKTIKGAIKYIANNYMTSSNFLKIDNKPVVFFYHVEGWFKVCNNELKIFKYIRNEFNNFGIEPYLIGISVNDISLPNINRFEGLDAISRYNDLPDFKKENIFQDFKLQTLSYTNKWNEIFKNLKKLNIAFIPSLSLGWNASLRFNGEINSCTKGYPLFPIVNTPSIEDVEWSFNLAKEFISKNSIPYYVVCAWNEWTENASLEYFLEYDEVYCLWNV